jgi:hypothetical protein
VFGGGVVGGSLAKMGKEVLMSIWYEWFIFIAAAAIAVRLSLPLLPLLPLNFNIPPD